jgi:cystathionine beta-lyase/cystathionine gamma-synthase
MRSDLHFNSKVIHGGQQPEETSGAVMPPIFQTSTYAQQSPGVHKGHEYARVTNPTRTALENLLASLENATYCAAFGSGCGAMDAVMKTLRPGNHVIASNDLYGGSYRLFTKVFEPFGIQYSFVDMTDVAQVEAAITSNTKLIWIETPTNPLLSIVDIEAIASLAKKHGIFTVVDNTFASPYLQRPLELGADAVVHSTTKYIGGHSDVIGGAVLSNDADFMENIRFQVKTTGAVPGPMDCYLLLRGAKTLALRVQRSCENAKALVEFLVSHPKIGMVNYPGLTTLKGHEIAKKQMDDFGAMISFTLKNDTMENAFMFMSSTSVFTLAESLGGVESLISHPASMTHASIPKEVRLQAGLSDSLIRLSVGIEDIRDLIADVNQALVHVPD